MSAIEEGVEGINSVEESTQVLVKDMEDVSDRMKVNQEITNELQRETDIFIKL